MSLARQILRRQVKRERKAGTHIPKPAGPGMSVFGVDTCLTDILLALMEANRKLYCTVSMHTLRRLLSEWHGLEVSVRTVRRHIQKFVDAGTFTRQARKKKLTSGQYVSLSNMYKVCVGAIKTSLTLGKRVWRLIKKTGGPQKDPQYSPYGDSYSFGPRPTQDKTHFVAPNELFLPGSGVLKMPT
jgi:hypothetical protein